MSAYSIQEQFVKKLDMEEKIRHKLKLGLLVLDKAEYFIAIQEQKD